MDYTIYCKDWTTVEEGEPLEHWASDSERFGKLERGDRVFVLSWRNARLWLFGHFTVNAIVTQAEAERRFRTTNLWKAKYHALAAEPFRRVIRHDITGLIPKITFTSRRRPQIDPDGDPQQVRGCRELTASAADLLARSD